MIEVWVVLTVKRSNGNEQRQHDNCHGLTIIDSVKNAEGNTMFVLFPFFHTLSRAGMPIN